MERRGAHTGNRVGVLFGGISPEHEVSVISAVQAMAALNGSDWNCIPVYVAKDGLWWSGEDLKDVATFKSPLTARAGCYRVGIQPTSGSGLVLRPEGRKGLAGRLAAPRPDIHIDVVLPVMHGGAGEDGSLQGLCETMGVAYAGSGPLPAALAMDKVAAKRWAETFGIPQVPYRAFSEQEWAGAEEVLLDELVQEPGLPAIVKPSGLGSSIGITRAATREALDHAIEEAFRYDEVVVVEKAVQHLRELNCSVLGEPGSAKPSVLEEPLSGEELLSFRDKYLRGGSAGKGSGSKTLTGARGSKQRASGMASLDRKIPAPVSARMTSDVRDLAVRVFEAFGCRGVVRIDFLLDDGTGNVYFNEINTMPGSMSFYLWEPTGVPFDQLLDKVLHLGIARHRARAGRVRSYDINLLSEKDLGGLKGSKG